MMKDKKQFRQNAILIAITVLLTIAMVWVNTYRRSVKYYNQGMNYYTQGKYLEAVTSFETSAHAYTPWNHYVKNSMEKLWEIGERLQREKEDPDYALIAFRSLRSSVYAIRSLYMPYKEWIPKCDAKIKELVLKQEKRLAEKQAAEPTPTL